MVQLRSERHEDQVHTEAAGSMPGGGNVLVLEHALASTAKFHVPGWHGSSVGVHKGQSARPLGCLSLRSGL